MTWPVELFVFAVMASNTIGSSAIVRTLVLADKPGDRSEPSMHDSSDNRRESLRRLRDNTGRYIQLEWRNRHGVGQPTECR